MPLVGNAQEQTPPAACADISGRYLARATSEPDAAKRHDDVRREVFKYSLPEKIGDFRQYEQILKTPYDSVSVKVENGRLYWALYDGNSLIQEFSFPVDCTASGWQAERISNRYLDGNDIRTRYVGVFSVAENGSLWVTTTVYGSTKGLLFSHQRDTVTSRAEFARLSN